MKPSPVPAAVLAALVLAWIPLTALAPFLKQSAGAYRILDLGDRATFLAAAAFLAWETLRSRGPVRVLTGGAAALAGIARFTGVRWLLFLAGHGLSAWWAYGVPAAVGATLVSVARRRAAEGG